MFNSLQADITEQKSLKMRTQKSMDNTVNDLRYKIKFRERQK